MSGCARRSWRGGYHDAIYDLLRARGASRVGGLFAAVHIAAGAAADMELGEEGFIAVARAAWRHQHQALGGARVLLPVENVITGPVVLDMTAVRGKCPRCGKQIRRNMRGELRAHGPRHKRCQENQ